MRVRVYNDNTYVYREKFKGEMIVIEPGKFVSMEDDDAVLFLGTFISPRVKGDNVPDPRGFKRLRIDKNTQEVAAARPVDQVSALKCQKCGYSATSPTDLSEHALLAHERDLLDADEVKKAAKR